jgi:hypothetical protein
VRGAILDSAMRPVVIVFFDPTSDQCSPFFQAPILRRPDFLFFQAAMEPFDVAVAFGVMIRRAPMRDAEPAQRLQEARGSELRSVVRRQRQDCFAAARVQQSITHTRYAQPTAGPAQILVMSDCQI